MKTAIIGSRDIVIDDIEKYIPPEITFLIAGGSRGIDLLAEQYADSHGIEKLIILPDYESYGKKAPEIRNKHIIDSAELIVAIWNGKSEGTKRAIDYAEKAGKQLKIILID